MAMFEFPSPAETLAIAIIATAVLDLWALSLNRALGLPATNWGHVGRWVAGVGSGTFRHGSIATTPAVPFERSIGWTTHYLVGFIYAFAYLIVANAMFGAPSAGSAVTFGMATVLAPWLILQPGLGIGFFASRAPRPHLTRALNLLAHSVFGLGLYLGWCIVGLLEF